LPKADNKSSKSVKSRAPQPQLRIIGGQWRGRKLSFPLIDGLRPTGDRIRETLFNWLTPDVHGARVLDLFAGSGALGLEALSRGAESCLLIEKHPQAAAQLVAHLKTLSSDKDTNRGRVSTQDGMTLLEQGNKDQPYNLVFIDPPFAADLWQKIADGLNQGNWLAPDAWIYVETPKDSTWSPPANWSLYRDKQAGQIRYRLFIFEMS